ncbi:MAG: lysophospholipid acyltransferase family protein [Saprospiraceae bacterium]
MLSSIRPWLKFSSVFLLLAFYLCRLILISFFTGKSQERSFRLRKKFCKASLRVLRIKYQKSGNQYPGTCLYVSNHRSMLDPLIELSWIDTSILSKAEVGDYPLLGLGAKETGVIFVERDNTKSRKAALSAIESVLLSNNSVMIYPEGTTYTGDLTGEFRRGAIELAYDLQIPVVPVMIEYPDNSYYWAHETLLAYSIRIFKKPGCFIVKGNIGEAIIAKERKEIVGLTQMAINKMIIEARI